MYLIFFVLFVFCSFALAFLLINMEILTLFAQQNYSAISANSFYLQCFPWKQQWATPNDIWTPTPFGFGQQKSNEIK